MLDVPFNVFYTKAFRLLKEGGNVTVTDKANQSVSAQKLNLHKHSRISIVHKMLLFFKTVNSLFEKKYGEPLWIQTELESGHIFNGSSEHFFNLNISDEEFVKYKSSIGDIDVTVPNDKKEKIFELLNSIKGKKINTDVVYIGSKQTNLGGGHQINSIVQIEGTNLQVDFEFLTYEKQSPSRFAKFSHSSAWEDIKEGFKGVLHKYLLQSLAGGSSLKTEQDIVLFTKTATKENPRTTKTFPEHGITFRKFSVDRGLRIDAYGQYFDEEGNPVMHDGKPVYKETPTDQSTYITEPEAIAKEIFGKKFNKTDLPLLGSFVGIVKLINKYNTPKDKIFIFKDFFRRLFGVGSQGFEKNNPESDYLIKKTGYEKIKNDLSITSAPDLPVEYKELMSLPEDSTTDPYLLKIKAYYENYRMVDQQE